MISFAHISRPPVHLPGTCGCANGRPVWSAVWRELAWANERFLRVAAAAATGVPGMLSASRSCGSDERLSTCAGRFSRSQPDSGRTCWTGIFLPRMCSYHSSRSPLQWGVLCWKITIAPEWWANDLCRPPCMCVCVSCLQNALTEKEAARSDTDTALCPAINIQLSQTVTVPFFYFYTFNSAPEGARGTRLRTVRGALSRVLPSLPCIGRGGGKCFPLPCGMSR